MADVKQVKKRVWYQSFKWLIEECKTGDIVKMCEACYSLLDGHNAFRSITAAGYARESMLQALADSVPLAEKGICEECGSDDVSVRVWRNLKTGQIDDGNVDPHSDTYCNACQGHCGIKFVAKESGDGKAKNEQQGAGVDGSAGELHSRDVARKS